MQAARREVELLGDMLWTEAALVEAAYHRLANPVQWMVRGFLPLDLLFAEALDEVEQLRVGYSELSAFSRASRRWFGTSPRSFRRRSPNLEAAA